MLVHNSPSIQISPLYPVPRNLLPGSFFLQPTHVSNATQTPKTPSPPTSYLALSTTSSESTPPTSLSPTSPTTTATPNATTTKSASSTALTAESTTSPTTIQSPRIRKAKWQRPARIPRHRSRQDTHSVRPSVPCKRLHEPTRHPSPSSQTRRSLEENKRRFRQRWTLPVHDRGTHHRIISYEKPSAFSPTLATCPTHATTNGKKTSNYLKLREMSEACAYVYCRVYDAAGSMLKIAKDEDG